VAAVIANMLQINPALTFAQIKQILQQTALPFGDPLVAGAGMVDALAAVTAAMPPPPNAPPAGTTADMVLSNLGGVYYNIGGNSILAGYQLAFVGTDWAFVTLGGFNDGDSILAGYQLAFVGLDWAFVTLGASTAAKRPTCCCATAVPAPSRSTTSSTTTSPRPSRWARSV
jgi:hypothetical protein